MVVGETHHFRNPPHDGHLISPVTATDTSRWLSTHRLRSQSAPARREQRGLPLGVYGLWKPLFSCYCFFVLEISWNTKLWFHTDEKFLRNPLYNFLMIMRSNSPTKIYPQARRFIFLPWPSRPVFRVDWSSWLDPLIFVDVGVGETMSSSWKVCFPWQYSSIHYYKPLISKKKHAL